MLKILDQLKIPYKIIKTSYNRLSLKYNRDNTLIIRVPNYLENGIIENFVTKNIEWIKKNYQKFTPINCELSNGDRLLYLGKEYQVEIIPNLHSGIYLLDQKVIIYINNKTTIPKIIEDWLSKQAELLFNELLNKCFQQMSKQLPKYPKLKIGKYKSRWGCCYVNKGEIALNFYLIHVPIHLIEYVIYHELCHFLIPNHSPNFHQLLRLYVHDEKVCRKQLKQYLIK